MVFYILSLCLLRKRKVHPYYFKNTYLSFRQQPKLPLSQTYRCALSFSTTARPARPNRARKLPAVVYFWIAKADAEYTRGKRERETENIAHCEGGRDGDTWTLTRERLLFIVLFLRENARHIITVIFPCSRSPR